MTPPTHTNACASCGLRHTKDCPNHTDMQDWWRGMACYVPPMLMTESVEAGLQAIANERATLPDSGAREEFGTGSVRDARDGKGRFDLLVAGVPDALIRQAVHFENGAKKYADHNWRKGQPLMRYIDSACRHLTKYTRGDGDEDHLAAATWNLLCHAQTLSLLERGEMSADLDDRPEWMRHA